jgi:hypothetical protein
VYADLLTTLGPTLGPLADELAHRDKRRSEHLFHLSTLLRPFFVGLSQLREALLRLARAPGIDNDIAHLLRDAAQHIVSGMESLLAEPDPRVLDESRRLMEIEFLLFEFTRTPERLRVWRSLSEHERNQEFAFEILRQREEKARGLPAQRVLFDQEEYRVHSSAVHPQPEGRRPLTAPDEASGLFYDAGDLLHHASRAWSAGLAAAEATRTDPGEPFEHELPRLDAVEAARKMMDEHNQKRGLLKE